MKKFYLFLVFFISVGTVFGQFLMKSETHILKTGDKHYFNITNNVEPGDNGANIVWDFSNLEYNSAFTSFMYGSNETEKASSIPEANSVLEEFGNLFYFKVSDGIIEQYGTVTKNNTITKFDKPFVKMVFPFNYGDTYSGDFSGTIEGNNDYKATFIGTYLLEADAYGTLLLPNNVIVNNTVRIKTVKEQCYNGKKCNCKTISYKWYAQDIRYPVLTIIQSSSSNGTKTFRTAYYSKVETIEPEKSEKLLNSEFISANVYPNPFDGEFTIDYTLLQESNVVIEIYDNTGKRVVLKSKNLQKPGSYTETITKDIIGEQLGIYHLRINAGNQIISKTIIRGE